MKNLFVVVFAFLIILLSGCEKQNLNQGEVKKKTGTELAVEYRQSLMSVLVSELQKNGPAGAVNVCADTAQSFTKAFGEKYGVEIKRSSYKFRNSENTPDENDLEALDFFSNLFLAGKLNPDTVFVKDLPGKEFNRYTAIPVMLRNECIVCHGVPADIDPKVRNILSKRYPDDLATGFKAGDFRGIISVKESIK